MRRVSEIAGNAFSKEFTRNVYVFCRSKNLDFEKSRILLFNIFSLDFHGNKGIFPGRVSLPARGEVLLYLRENGALEVLGF